MDNQDDSVKPSVSYPEFSKLDLRVAVVKNAEEITGADKLLKLTLDVGSLEAGGLGERIVAAGIKEWYKPDELVGKQVIYLANLEPRMLRGVESQGMVLAAESEAGAVLLAPSKTAPAGSIIR
ncbi:MAG TPA: methionine--tRNA ligase [Candidatus Woesebacteria bacterium]|mgnify:CR=1 FL=1|nr:methionine--tRNA ligase [Candidatus Woesebacteria bacterium]